ncbi:hypothetical protein ASPTUDRAFT_40775 [Aspergillus tubingensis CBS 134.48]|uniref:Uncharacterized protein n=1 Tax=Aspergillus tubingensis (strain CBS 134.48) TaxID=767770 RepID=A0A1L9N6K0_ASPTC|nr:hypothetical protein ASPTUDRAFT_40775 [Aspergillus tubingensis CBS 134.48]
MTPSKSSWDLKITCVSTDEYFHERSRLHCPCAQFYHHSLSPSGAFRFILPMSHGAHD